MQEDKGRVLGIDYIKFWVSNPMMAASFYTSRFGFEYYAQKV
jgi:4-hydroxyphenylpyruvate dioxygenase